MAVYSLLSPFPLSTEKKMHNLKVESYVLFGELTEDYSPGYSLSNSSEELLQRGNGGARMYMNFLLEKISCSRISKDYS